MIQELKDGAFKIQARIYGEECDGVVDSLPAAIAAVAARERRIFNAARENWGTI